MFYTPIRAKFENVENYVSACLSFHNYLRLTDNASYCPNGFTDLRYPTGNLQQYEWRGLVSGNQESVPISRVKGSRYSNQAIKIRNAIENFVNIGKGSVSWQEEHLTRTSYTGKIQQMNMNSNYFSLLIHI